jgi:hypothetical protein
MTQVRITRSSFRRNPPGAVERCRFEVTRTQTPNFSTAFVQFQFYPTFFKPMSMSALHGLPHAFLPYPTVCFSHFDAKTWAKKRGVTSWEGRFYNRIPLNISRLHGLPHGFKNVGQTVGQTPTPQPHVCPSIKKGKCGGDTWGERSGEYGQRLSSGRPTTDGGLVTIPNTIPKLHP